MRDKIFIFMLVLFVIFGIVSQMIDVWILGIQSSLLDFIFGWASVALLFFIGSKLEPYYKD